MTSNPRIEIADPVAEALADGRAVVALESTIISHGMPYPQNVTMATEIEDLVRANGAVPATIAVIDGVARVGLNPDQIVALADGSTEVYKATTRDLGWLLAEGFTGATTVAATMFLAHAAGIRVFATGGIGGVHRGAEHSFDISADLGQLGSTPVAVISAGIKSILDIGLTLEHLETLGVPTVVVDHDWYPSFYSRSSALAAPRRVADASAVATLMHAHWDVLGCTTGISVANPISAEAEIPSNEIDSVIDDALRAADRDGISGQAVTPYLLAAIVERTGGRSLRANIELVRANAAFAAQVAIHDARRPS